MTPENHQQAIESKNENHELGTVFLNRESEQETKVHFLFCMENISESKAMEVIPLPQVPEQVSEEFVPLSYSSQPP